MMPQGDVTQQIKAVTNTIEETINQMEDTLPHIPIPRQAS